METPVITIVRDDGLGDLNPRLAIDGARWVLRQGGLENFDSTPYTLSTQDYAQYDGAYLMGERSGTQDRSISAIGFGDVAALREEAERFFIPGREYEVHVEAEGRSRFFRGRQYALSLATDSLRRAQLLDWTCLALDPWFMSEDEKRFDIAEAAGARGFPFMSASAASTGGGFPVIAGFVVGVVANEIRMVNGGDSTAYPRFDVTATGEVVNPSVSVVDSAGAVVSTVGFDMTMEAGDELVIDFSARPTSVELNGENALHLTTPESTLSAGIDVGDFSLVWSAESGDASLHIRPSIRERYSTI